jgi:NAD(P)H-dependent FMN reductase
LRLLLSNLGVHVAPGQMALARADKAFDDAGGLADAAQRAMLEKCIADMLRLTAGVAAPRD